MKKVSALERIGMCKGVVATALMFATTLSYAAGEPVVVREESCSDHVRFAAFDLARHLSMMTGEKVPVVVSNDAKIGEASMVFEVGTSAAAEMIGRERIAKLPMNGWAVRSSNGKVAISGVNRFGVAYGVYELLEKKLGCRWYTPFDPPTVPKADLKMLGNFEFIGAPALCHRWIHALDNCASRLRDGALFGFRNKLNVLGGGEFRNIELPDGCKHLTTDMTIVRCAHTLFSLIPPHGKEEYFKKHPEWFSYVREGDAGRRVDNRQLCFSNPELRRELEKNLLATVSKMGECLYSLSAEDVGGPLCECDRCLELQQRYGSPGASLFAYLSDFAKLVEAKNPKAMLCTLAYRKDQTQIPPNDELADFADNVIVLFAPIQNDISKCMDHPNNDFAYRDLLSWGRKAKNIWAWYYPVPYRDHSPFGGAFRFAKDLRLMKDAGLTGACYEHTMGIACGTGFYDMYVWMLTKLFSDPTLDEKALMQEFCNFAYGPAGKRMFEYALELEGVRERHLAYTQGRQALWASYTPERLVRWSKTFNEMEALCSDAALCLQRVREARVGLDFRILRNYRRIAVAEPEFAAVNSAQSICARSTNTVQRGYVRRGRYDKFGSEYQRMMKDIPYAAFVADSPDAQMPPPFREVNPDNYRQSFDVYDGMGCKSRSLAGAAFGKAVWDDKEKPRGDGTFPWCIYDDENERYLASGKISGDMLVEGEFAFVRLGKVTLDNRCSVVLGRRWGLKYRLNEFFDQGEDNDWEVYVSMRLEGPAYFKNAKFTENRAAFDRLVLVRPGSKVALKGNK